MKVAFDEIDEMIHFRIYDFDEKYEELLQMCFYEKHCNGYVKRYKKSERHLDKLMSRYADNAQRMFDQLGYFADVPWASGLDAFCNMVNGKGIDWWLTGSCAACIRGINLNPHDVDIMISSNDVLQMTELFQDVLIEPISDTNGWLTKDFGVVFMHCRIDIASDPSPELDVPIPVDCGPYARDHLETVRWNGHLIRVPPLELQISVNKKRNRLDRVKLMEEFAQSGRNLHLPSF